MQVRMKRGLHTQTRASHPVYLISGLGETCIFVVLMCGSQNLNIVSYRTVEMHIHR